MSLQAIESQPEQQASSEAIQSKLQLLKVCTYCGRLKTEQHETYFFGDKSSYEHKVIICVDYVDGTKIVYEKQMEKPKW
jgi:hypothetical protein